jgi:hypothetical protein
VYSEVSGTTPQHDHVAFAAKQLLEKGFVDWECVVATDTTLLLDYDDRPFGAPLPELFGRILAILKQAFDGTEITYKTYASKGGNTHVIVTLPHYIPIWIVWHGRRHSAPILSERHYTLSAFVRLNPIGTEVQG